MKLHGLSEEETHAEHLFRRAEEAYDRSTLPREPDYKAVNDFLVQTLKKHTSEVK